MIKAVATGADGVPLLILGLSRRNTELLLEGKPISVDMLGITGLKAKILIIAGETEEALTEQLKPFITADTRVQGPEPWEKKGGG